MKKIKRQPIFLFSAGWRSGSTLLQRMITASGKNLIWGETGGALNYLTDAWHGYIQMLGDGAQKFKFGYGGNGLKQYEKFCKNKTDGVNKWIASMNAPEKTIVDAYRNFFEYVYANHASELGYDGWGIKEVQSGREAADFLRILYPKAKFIFLVRHPMDCLLSIKRRNWMDESNPKKALQRYATHWTRLAKEFREIPYGFIIKYESLLNNSKKLEEMSAYIELENLKEDFALNSHADWKAVHNKDLTFFEKLHILKIVRTEMKAFGYN